MRFTVGVLGNTGVCRMCKVVAVDLHGRGYKLAETGEYCTVRLSLMCGGEVSAKISAALSLGVLFFTCDTNAAIGSVP